MNITLQQVIFGSKNLNDDEIIMLNRFYVILSCTINYEILNLVVHTKICANENYPLYSIIILCNVLLCM